MKCNLCGGTTWGNMNKRKSVKCLTCFSLERTRALKFVLDSHGVPAKDARILHYAPEKGLSAWFERVSPEGYDPVDIDPSRYPHTRTRRFDLMTDIRDLPSDHYDLIVHVHVLEHVPMNIAPVLFHLHRALKPDGLHVFSVPFIAAPYDEYFGQLPHEVAKKRFGQFDHVRLFGSLDIDRHIGSILRIPDHYSLYDYGSKVSVRSSPSWQR